MESFLLQTLELSVSYLPFSALRHVYTSHQACYPRQQASIYVGLATKIEKSEARCRQRQSGLFILGREEMLVGSGG